MLTDIPRWLERRHVYILDPGYQDYPQHHANLLAQLRDPKPQPPVLNQTPPLPDTYVERPTLQSAILDQVIGVSRAQPTIGVTTLLGGGGFGKTNLVQAIGGDPDVTNSYAGGVYYVTVGETRQEFARDLNIILRDLHKPEVSPDDAPSKVREALLERECLLILDDVWGTHDIAGLLPLPAGRVLISTREPSVAALCTTTPIAVAEMEAHEAAAMLTRYLPRQTAPTSQEQQALRHLGERLGEWPLLLNIFGGVLREEVVVNRQSLKAALAYVNEGLDTEGLAVFGRDDAGRNAALEASMSVSLRRFTEAERSCLYKLAIFPDDVAVSAGAAAALWRASGAMNDFQAKKLLRRFAGSFTLPEIGGAFRLHDKMKEYLGGKLGGGALADLHAALIAALGDPHALPDAYAWRYYAYHLIAARQADALGALLIDPRWLRAKLGALAAPDLLADFAAYAGVTPAAPMADAELVRLIESAVRLSLDALEQDQTQWAQQMRGRLPSQHQNAGAAAFVARLTDEPGALRLIDNGYPALLAAGGALLRTMTGHTNGVDGALALADSRLLSWSYVKRYTSPRDTTLRLWSADGAPLAALEGHSDSVYGALALADGRLLSWARDRTLRLWRADGVPLEVLHDWRADSPGAAIAWARARGFDPAALLEAEDALIGDAVLYWHRGERITQYDRHSGAVRAQFIADSSITCLALSRDGRTLAAGDEAGRVLFFRVG